MRLLAGLSVSLVALAGPHPGLSRFESVEPHMGTLVRVTVYVTGEAAARAAFRAAFDRIHQLDGILSDYRADSELNRLTRTAVGRPVPVSEDLFAVLLASRELAEVTGGAFDVTQGPVIRLWRAARHSGRVPDRFALQAAAGRGGFRKLHLDRARRTVTLDTADMALDLGGIGKGYAASEALEALGALGIRSALVAVSGDLAFSDAPPGQHGWRIALPEDEPPVELAHAAVSTSGHSAQYVDVDGVRYSHIIDPSSGMGLRGDTTVTVIARHGLDADGLSTSISILGPRRGLELIESRPDTAALIVHRTDGVAKVYRSSRFPGRLDRTTR